MSFRRNVLSIVLLPALLLGCGGGDDFSFGNGSGDFSGGGGSSDGGGSDGGSGGSDGGSGSTSTVSYYPLSVYERYKDFSGYEEDDVFQGEGALIPRKIINPINASTLAPVTNAVAEDYVVTIDDIEIDPLETFPLLQKIEGMNVQLKTAIVFDTSNSMTLTADQYTGLKTEVKNYIDKVRAHSNPVIANQKFVIWTFDNDATDISNGFSADDAYLKGRIDTVTRNIGTSSNLHKAIVKVIGRYVDTEADFPIDFDTDGPSQTIFDIDNASDLDDDLVDEIKSDGSFLTQMIVFSSGGDSKLEMSQELMINAIESQGFVTYESSSQDEQTFTKKPVFYYVTGGSSAGQVYSALSDNAEATVQLTAVDNAYSFSDGLIANQVAAIDRRIDLDNQYIYRYAFLPRQGDHVAVFASKTTASNYSLTSDYDSDWFIDNALTDLGTPYEYLSSLLEITGVNGEYISGNSVSFADLTTFKYETRWTSDPYDSADLTWSLVGGTGIANTDNTYTVTAVTGASASLTVTHATNGQTATIVIEN